MFIYRFLPFDTQNSRFGYFMLIWNSKTSIKSPALNLARLRNSGSPFSPPNPPNGGLLVVHTRNETSFFRFQTWLSLSAPSEKRWGWDYSIFIWNSNTSIMSPALNLARLRNSGSPYLPPNPPNGGLLVVHTRNETSFFSIPNLTFTIRSLLPRRRVGVEAYKV